MSNTGSAGTSVYGVRRLMPDECCRLQGFPDDWLDLDPPLADGPKYRMLGNAVAVPVAEWIGRRIVANDNAPDLADEGGLR
jgi:DNA (cytosine-5)-methyltransferase 1